MSTPDNEIEPEFVTSMNDLARFLDISFNGNTKGKDRRTGFVLLTFPYADHAGKCNYISNGVDRVDMATMFTEMAARLRGQPEMVGNA